MSEAQVVQTTSGAVRGFTEDGVDIFLGIPYASPPVGALRWASPVPPSEWADTLWALAYPPACPQKQFSQGDTIGTVVGDEDCLYLNVWTPSLQGRRPVMVFIHGGGNQQGSTDVKALGAYLYDGKNLAQRGDVVVVTVQYRLGALGNLVHPGLEAESPYGKSGNYGVQDLMLALRWVRQNIAGFGGDTARVTLFGESAGGVHVGNLMIMPAAAGLFHRAIIQSASPRLKAYEAARNEGIAFAQQLGASGSLEQQVAHLRALPPDSLVQADVRPISSGGIVQSPWQPVHDGYWFPQMPLHAVQSGQHHRVPLMIGSNSDEMSLSVLAGVTPAMLVAFVQAFIPAPYQQQALALYPPGTTNEQARASYVALVTDLQFTAPVRRVAECVSKNQEEPVWRYFFSFRHTVPALAPYGAYHGMELFYVFNTWENTILGSGPFFSPADDSVQRHLLRYWTNFARTGDPNSLDAPLWPAYEGTQDCYIDLKASPDGSQCGLRTEQCNFWDQVVDFLPCLTSAYGEANAAAPLWTLFPNPTPGLVRIDGPAAEEVHVRLFDLSGRLLWEEQSSRRSFDLSALPPGTYLVRISSQQSAHATVVVRQR